MDFSPDGRALARASDHGQKGNRILGIRKGSQQICEKGNIAFSRAYQRRGLSEVAQGEIGQSQKG
jgi:hypothetical protein